MPQDKYDDAIIGIKSTALRLGDATPRWLAGFATAMITGLLTVGYNAGQTWPYYLTVAFVSGHLARQVSRGCLENVVYVPIQRSTHLEKKTEMRHGNKVLCE